MAFWRVFLLAAAATVQAGPTTLEQHIDDATGAGAVDCGTFSTVHNGLALPPRPSSTATNKVESMRESLSCAERALKDHKGFKIIQSSPGPDAEIASGVLGNAEGVTIWFFTYSKPFGGRGYPQTFQTKPCSLTDVRIVPTPRGNHEFKCGE